MTKLEVQRDIVHFCKKARNCNDGIYRNAGIVVWIWNASCIHSWAHRN